MIQNIIDIGHAAHIYACAEEDPALILFDLTAAFPSIHRDFTQEALEAFGAPTMVNNAMTNFYRNNTLTIKRNNQLYNGFCATRGIRQGCPLIASHLRN